MVGSVRRCATVASALVVATVLAGCSPFSAQSAGEDLAADLRQMPGVAEAAVSVDEQGYFSASESRAELHIRLRAHPAPDDAVAAVDTAYRRTSGGSGLAGYPTSVQVTVDSGAPSTSPGHDLTASSFGIGDNVDVDPAIVAGRVRSWAEFVRTHRYGVGTGMGSSGAGTSVSMYEDDPSTVADAFAEQSRGLPGPDIQGHGVIVAPDPSDPPPPEAFPTSDVYETGAVVPPASVLAAMDAVREVNRSTRRTWAVTARVTWSASDGVPSPGPSSGPAPRGCLRIALTDGPGSSLAELDGLLGGYKAALDRVGVPYTARDIYSDAPVQPDRVQDRCRT